MINKFLTNFVAGLITIVLPGALLGFSIALLFLYATKEVAMQGAFVLFLVICVTVAGCSINQLMEED